MNQCTDMTTIEIELYKSWRERGERDIKDKQTPIEIELCMVCVGTREGGERTRQQDHRQRITSNVIVRESQLIHQLVCVTVSHTRSLSHITNMRVCV